METSLYLLSMLTTELGWQGWVTIGVFICTFVALVREIRPPDITMLIGAGVLMIIGILTPQQFLEGFTNDVILTIAMLCIVVRAVEINGLIGMVATHVLSTSKNYTKQLLSLIVPTMGFSAFLNNTPIVLLMTPIVRKWSLSLNTRPSQFLIPLSYATILGGLCTIIGTSTNLIVEGLIRQDTTVEPLGFFELAWVGIPCCIVGGTYLIFFSKRLLVPRVDSATRLIEESKTLAVEFLLLDGAPLVDKRIREVSGSYFPEQFLLQVERGNTLIDAPARDFILRAGDRLVFSGDIQKIAELHAVPGLQSLADPHFSLDVSSSHFSEVVLSTSSMLIGKTPKAVDFRRNFGASIIAVYRQGKRVTGPVGDIHLRAGDTLMLLSSEAWHPNDSMTKDFYLMRSNEKLPIFNKKKAFLVVMAILAIVIPSMLGFSIALASTAAAFFLVLTQCVTLQEAQRSIAWPILLLIAFSFAFGRALEVTGVAAYFAHHLLSIVGTSPYALISGIILIAILGTEFMSNNAAALIFFPIALQLVQLAGYSSPESVKAVAVAVAVGSSCGFAIPTGYQTHMIVYGPGGYRFTDFIKIGLPLDILVWIVGSLLIPLLWPFGN